MDHRVLKGVDIGADRKVTVCQNCAHLIRLAQPAPTTVGEIRAVVAVAGDRRTGPDRRGTDRRQDDSISFGEWDRRSKRRRTTDRIRTIPSA